MFQISWHCVLLLLAPSAFGQTGSQSTATPLGDRPPEKTGFAPGLAFVEAPHVVWQFSKKRNGNRSTIGLSDPAAANGILFFGDDKGIVRALTAKQGVKIWSHDHGERVYDRPTCDGERLYFTSRKGVTAVLAGSGRQVWHRAIEHGAGRCVVQSATNIVYCGGGDGWMYAFSAVDGEQKWKCSIMDDAPEDPPGFPGQRARMSEAAARPTGVATDERAVYQAIFDQSRVVAFDAATGRKQWTFQTKGWIYGDPAVDMKRLFVGSQDKHVYCLNKSTGRILWKSATQSRIESGPAVDQKHLYIPSCDGNMYCFAKQTGKLVWKFAVDRDNGKRSAIYSAPVVTSDSLYFAAAEGHVYALDTATGALRWKLRPSATSDLYSSLATDGTRLFVQSRPKSEGVGTNTIFAVGPQ